VRKVLQIVPAEAMNAFAANSLLKTLEEPVASSLLILIGEAPERLPATVTSRCQRIGMLPPDAETGAAWLSARVDAKRFDLALLLRLAHDAPLRALTLADAEGLAGRERAFEQLAAVARGEQDPIAGAAAWQPLDPRLVLEWLSAWVSDLVRLVQTPGAAYLSSPDKHAQLMALTPGLDCAKAHRYLRRVLDYRALIDAPLNKGLLFEALLVDWARLVRGTE
jgi:DNA polymerase-3 subunit delta'